LQAHIGAAVTQDDEQRRDALALHERGLLLRKLQGHGQGRTAPAGQADHGPPRTHERARHGQQQLGLRAAEGHDAHAVAPSVGLLEQEFDGAFGLGQPLQRGRARSVQRQDHACRCTLLIAMHMKVLGANGHPLARVRAMAQALPWCSGAQRGQHVQPRLPAGATRPRRQRSSP
jgi:hypothetical protein